MTNFKGTSGSDYLIGTEQSDIIYGYEGDDILTGGSGKDNLVGGGGNDILTGGEGRDTFELYSSGGGIDTITDFSANDILVVNDPPIDFFLNKAPNNGSLPEQSDIIYGYEGDDILTGGSGKDNLVNNGNLPKGDTIKVSGNGSLPKGGTIFVTTGSKLKSSSYLPDYPDTGAFVIKGSELKSSSYLTYNPNTGALFYLLEQQLAWLPTNLDFAVVPPSRPLA